MKRTQFTKLLLVFTVLFLMTSNSFLGAFSVPNNSDNIITIIYDSNDDITVETAFIMQEIASQYDNNIMFGVKNRQDLLYAIKFTTGPIIYVFHGTTSGWLIGDKLVHKLDITEAINESPAKAHFMAACDSNSFADLIDKNVYAKGMISNIDATWASLLVNCMLIQYYEQNTEKSDIVETQKKAISEYYSNNMMDLMYLLQNPEKPLYVDIGDIGGGFPIPPPPPPDPDPLIVKIHYYTREFITDLRSELVIDESNHRTISLSSLSLFDVLIAAGSLTPFDSLLNELAYRLEGIVSTNSELISGCLTIDVPTFTFDYYPVTYYTQYQKILVDTKYTQTEYFDERISTLHIYKYTDYYYNLIDSGSSITRLFGSISVNSEIKFDPSKFKETKLGKLLFGEVAAAMTDETPKFEWYVMTSVKMGLTIPIWSNSALTSMIASQSEISSDTAANIYTNDINDLKGADKLPELGYSIEGTVEIGKKIEFKKSKTILGVTVSASIEAKIYGKFKFYIENGKLAIGIALGAEAEAKLEASFSDDIDDGKLPITDDKLPDYKLPDDNLALPDTISDTDSTQTNGVSISISLEGEAKFYLQEDSTGEVPIDLSVKLESKLTFSVKILTEIKVEFELFSYEQLWTVYW